MLQTGADCAVQRVRSWPDAGDAVKKARPANAAREIAGLIIVIRITYPCFWMSSSRPMPSGFGSSEWPLTDDPAQAGFRAPPSERRLQSPAGTQRGAAHRWSFCPDCFSSHEPERARCRRARTTFPVRRCRFELRRNQVDHRSAITTSAPSSNGRWSDLASSQDARIQTSRSSSVVRITGMALRW